MSRSRPLRDPRFGAWRDGLELYFQVRNKNTGRVTRLENRTVRVNIAKSWGVGDLTFNLAQCIGFTPKLQDRVVLCRNKDGVMCLSKLKKSRQDGPIWPKPPRKRPVAPLLPR